MSPGVSHVSAVPRTPIVSSAWSCLALMRVGGCSPAAQCPAGHRDHHQLPGGHRHVPMFSCVTSCPTRFLLCPPVSLQLTFQLEIKVSTNSQEATARSLSSLHSQMSLHVPHAPPCPPCPLCHPISSNVSLYLPTCPMLPYPPMSLRVPPYPPRPPMSPMSPISSTCPVSPPCP